jgi:predicted DNA binding CopG/RHH family protein
MSEETQEKESKGSEKVMLTMSSKLKSDLEQRASEIGIPLTQYIMTLIINDLRTPLKS